LIRLLVNPNRVVRTLYKIAAVNPPNPPPTIAIRGLCDIIELLKIASRITRDWLLISLRVGKWSSSGRPY
jgi:hypothetical protein